jgi:hypothetical protein
MLIHTCVLLLLLTGAFNTWRAWGDYKLDTPLLHALWGPHMILGLIAMTLALILLAPRTPPTWHRAGTAVTLLILFAAVLLASTLKYFHDQAVRTHLRHPVAVHAAP